MNPYLAALLSISLDYGSTKYALSQGAIESNSFVSHHLEAKKAVQVIAVGYALQKLERKSKKAAKITKIGLFLVHGSFAFINIRNGLKSKPA